MSEGSTVTNEGNLVTTPASVEGPRQTVAARRVAGVRLRRNAPVGWYDAGTLLLTPGDYVVVSGGRGTNVGQVVVAPDQIVGDVPTADLPPVLDRIDASSADQVEAHVDLRNRAIRLANDLARARGLNVRITRAAVAADGSKVSLFCRGEDQLADDVLAAIALQLEAWVVAHVEQAREREL